MFLPYSTLPFTILVVYLRYLRDFIHMTSARKGRGLFQQILISLVFLIKGGESWMKLFLPFTLVFYLEQPLVEWSKISWCLEGSTPPTRDGPLLCSLSHSYNKFNLPTSLLSQVPLIWQVSYIVFFYLKYLLDVFTSLYTSPPRSKKLPHFTLDTPLKVYFLHNSYP